MLGQRAGGVGGEVGRQVEKGVGGGVEILC